MCALEKWRKITNFGLSAAKQMTLDQVLLTKVGESSSPPALRFLSFNQPTVLVGYHQDLASEVRLDYCREQSIDIGRRLTGGGALYWSPQEVGWELFVPQTHRILPEKIEEAYRIFCTAAADGLRKLGVDSHFRPRNDIEVGKRKISGAGATSLNGGFLFQGTVLVDYDVEDMIRSLRVPTEKLKDKELASVRERVTSLKECLGRTPVRSEIISALTQGFAEALNIEPEDSPLTADEEQLCEDLLPYFSSPSHIDPPQHRKPARSLYGSAKTAGGIIKINIKTDTRLTYISQVLITGDFLISPPQIINDLECALKQVRLKAAVVSQAIYDFFAANNHTMLKMHPDDIVAVFTQIITKSKHQRLGLEPSELNHVFPVARALEELQSVSCVLLPYCAKSPDCEYRNKQGCSQCGKCSFGEASSIAESYGLRVLTILNFEHLRKVLTELAESNANGYVGCCCESFYLKHSYCFNRSGLPGLLIDIEQSTCFDLNKQIEAEQGGFENHTELKLDIFKKALQSFVGGSRV